MSINYRRIPELSISPTTTSLTFSCRNAVTGSAVVRRAPSTQRHTSMEDHAPGHLDDFELFRAHAQGGTAVGKNCAQSLPSTPETSWRSRGRRGICHSNSGGGSRGGGHGKQSLQRSDNFEIAANDEPEFYEYVNSLQQQQQQQSRNNRRLGRSPSRRCASQCQPVRESKSRRTIKRDAPRSQSLRDNRAHAALGSPPSPASPVSPSSPASPATPRERLINRRPKAALRRSLTSDANNGGNEPPNGSHKIFRVRSFYTTRRGVVNQGDTFKLLCPKLVEEYPHSPSTGSRKEHAGKVATNDKLTQCIDQCKSLALDERAKKNMSVFHVHVLGSHGVGKTTLVQQLMTSEYLGDQENPPDAEAESCVCVTLDGEEFLVEFVDVPYDNEDCISTEADVYLVVYSVTDSASFAYAGELLPRLRRRDSRSQAVFIVASKQDLVRGRVICEEDGKALAREFDGKYIEISAMLAHKVDDVLVALSREICRSRKRHRHMHDTGCIPQGAFGSLRKFFRRESPHSKSEDSVI